MLGLKGIYVDRPEQLGAAWDEALRADRPVILEVRIRPQRAASAAAYHGQGCAQFPQLLAA